jgi:hypothetical protein
MVTQNIGDLGKLMGEALSALKHERPFLASVSLS